MNRISFLVQHKIFIVFFVVYKHENKTFFFCRFRNGLESVRMPDNHKKIAKSLEKLPKTITIIPMLAHRPVKGFVDSLETQFLKDIDSFLVGRPESQVIFFTKFPLRYQKSKKNLSFLSIFWIRVIHTTPGS